MAFVSIFLINCLVHHDNANSYTNKILSLSSHVPTFFVFFFFCHNFDAKIELDVIFQRPKIIWTFFFRKCGLFQDLCAPVCMAVDFLKIICFIFVLMEFAYICITSSRFRGINWLFFSFFKSVKKIRIQRNIDYKNLFIEIIKVTTIHILTLQFKKKISVKIIYISNPKNSNL